MLIAVSHVAILGFAGLLLWAAYCDVQSLTIPNRISLAMVLLFPALVLTGTHEIDWLSSLGVAAAALVAGFLLFALRLVGGGDVKLIAAASLWAGPGLVLPFLFVTALAGGAMAMVLYMRHRIAGSAGWTDLAPASPDFGKQPMPYAVAIAVGGLYVAFTFMRLG